MFCQRCGTRVADNAKFCKECGTRVVAPTAPTKPPIQPTVRPIQPKPQVQPKLPKDDTPAREYAYELCQSWSMIGYAALLCIVGVVTVVQLLLKIFGDGLIPVDGYGSFQNQDVVNAISLFLKSGSIALLAVGACFAVFGGFYRDSYSCTTGLKCMMYGARLGMIEWIVTAVYYVVWTLAAEFLPEYMLILLF